MIFNFIMDEAQILPYVQGVKRFFVIDDVDNIYVNDYLLFSDNDISVIYHVDYIDKNSPELKEGTMLLSLSPCEIKCKCFDCPQVLYRNDHDDDLPFPELEMNPCCDMDEVNDLPFT